MSEAPINLQQLGSLEGVSTQEMQYLASAAKILFSGPHRKEAQRIMKKINPNATIPELDQDDAIERVRLEEREEREKLQKQWDADKQATKRAETLRALADDGVLPRDAVKIDPEKKVAPIEQFMIDNSITDYSKAANLYKLSQQQATPTPPIGVPDVTHPQLPTIDLKGAGARNTQDWARQEAHQAIADLRSGKVSAPNW